MILGVTEFICNFAEKTGFSDSCDRWQGLNGFKCPVEYADIHYWLIVFALFLVVGIWVLSNGKSSRRLESLSNHLLGISLCVWFLGVLVYIVGFYKDALNALSVVPRAIVASFKMFVVANELARVPADMQNDAIYMSAFSLVHFMAAFIAFMFIFKMLGYKIKSSLNIFIHKLRYAKGKVVHLFWGVNEASCLLAEDIRRKYPAETIIFIDIDKDSEDNTKKKPTLSNITNTITISNSEIARLDAIGALVDHCYGGPASISGDGPADVFGVLHLKAIGSILKKSRQAYFYLMSDDEATNISGALNLQQDKLLRSLEMNRSVIYVHARRDAYNEVFDHYSQYDSQCQRMKIKLVDSACLSILTLKHDARALPVNSVRIHKATGIVDSRFTSMIVGFGATGQEAFKFLYEYSAFVGPDKKKSPFKCCAIDEKMDKISGLVREKMPAIGEDELSLIQAATDSGKFWETINNVIGSLNYVVITLNDDDGGMSLAVNLFKYALKYRRKEMPMLKIMIRCYDNANENRMSEVANNLNKSVEGNNVEIRLFGRERDLYCCDTILSDATLREAKEYNKVYENSDMSADEQWEKNFGEAEIQRLMTEKKMSRYHALHDINRRIAQNVSNSLHCRTKMILMGFAENEVSERLRLYYGYVTSRKDGTTAYKCGSEDSELLHNMAMVEHERWIASHKLMGYTYDQQNDCVQKHHKCICQWDELDELTRSYDCNVVDTTIKMSFHKAMKSN